MPTPRMHGGAPLAHFPLNVPAFNGLNKQGSSAVLDPSWATRLDNTVLDNANRIASRKGWTDLTTTTAAAGNFKQLFEWNNSGTMELIATSSDSKIYKSADDGDTWSDITGTATISSTNGQFHEFNGNVVYCQLGQKPATYTGTSFAHVADANCPDGAISLSAFGRLWVVDDTDGVTIKYSALLDETDWTSADSGQVAMQNVWTGADTIAALEAFNGSLVVFGGNNIIVWTDGQGSALGIDPLQMYVVDTLGGIGCVARDSVVNVDGDLWFLSRSGVMSFTRLIQERSNPLENLSKNVQDYLRDLVAISDADDIRAVYSQQERFYLLSLPVGSAAESGGAIAFDTRGRLQDGTVRVMGTWTGMVPRCVIQRTDLTVVSALLTKTGKVGSYSGYIDDASTYQMSYESGWSELNSSDLKILKRLEGLLFTQVEQNVTFKWAFDFVETFKQSSVTYPAAAGAAEYGDAEFSVDEWGGESTSLNEKRVGGRGTGEYIKLGFATIINNGAVAAQQLNLYTKIGRTK